MPKVKPVERKRLKDKIVERISKAVKQIQRLKHDREDEIVLVNTDWQFHKLVENLDHALMHGLKNITNGYWVVVQEFTPKATIKDIKLLRNVTTNLGKGRAWLYFSLVDKLFESYIHCYMDNQTRIAKYYLKDALMLDAQQVEVIHTLVAGLEFIMFNLEVDVPYLDLSSHEHIKTSNSSCEEDYENDDAISIVSASSNVSSVSTATEVGVDLIDSSSDCNKSVSKFQTSISDPAFQNIANDQHFSTRSSIDATSLPNSEEIEVIRHKVKTHGGRSKKKKHNDKKKIDTHSLNSNDGASMASVSNRDSPESLSSSHHSSDLPHFLVQNQKQHLKNDSPLTPESGYRSALDQNSPKNKSVLDSNAVPKVIEDSDLKNKIDKNNFDRTDSNIISKGNNEDNKLCPSIDEGVLIDTLNELTDTVTIYDTNVVYKSESSLAETAVKNQKIVQDNCVSSQKKDSSSDNLTIYDEIDIKESSLELTLTPDKDFKESDTQKILDKDKEKLSDTKTLCKTSGASVSNGSIPSKRTVVPDWEVLVDNNTKLSLMLEVFTSEEEMLMKMYKTCEGHTEGEVTPIYLVITDYSLYIVTTGVKNNCRFHREATITFKELDYISLSLCDQVINIVCTNRRKQFWITTGEELLTKSIVGHIDNAIRHSTLNLPRLSVLTDATTQKIAIKKWAASECLSQKSELLIMHYSLVYWEDTESHDSSSWLQIAPTKSGILKYKSHNSYFGFGGAVWKEAYCVLKDSALYLYEDQEHSLVNSQAISCIQLNHEECQGCRTTRVDDCSNCLEILLKDGTSLLMSASNLIECQEWIQSLCQVVAQGMGSIPLSSDCLACCCVVTSTKLLLCHEDVQTNFYRTLGAANVMDISAVHVHKECANYCVIKFDAPSEAETQKWVLYFMSEASREAFIANLALAWKKIFQGKRLNVTDMVDIRLRRHCQEKIKFILQQRYL